MKHQPLIVHIIHRLSVGGLENGLINIVNHSEFNNFKHVIICLKDATQYKNKIINKNLVIYCMKKKDGHDFLMFYRLYLLLKELHPDIVHTRNLATLECQLPAILAGVKHRIHGEHGWDVYDPNGQSLKYQIIRRLFSPLIHFYIPLSLQLKQYLINKIGIPSAKIKLIPNGVNCNIFKPGINKPTIYDYQLSSYSDLITIGTIGRMHGVKDQITLVKAFLLIIKLRPHLKSILRLVMIGDGPLRNEAIALLSSAGLENLAWLPGERNDIPDILRIFDIFVLPSTSEGLSNAILEAMATKLPVIATKVGGNIELIIDNKTGRLIEPSNPEMLADTILQYIDFPQKMKEHGTNGLFRVISEYSLDRMINQYYSLYNELIGYQY